MLQHAAEECIVFRRGEKCFVAEIMLLHDRGSYHDSGMAQGTFCHQSYFDISIFYWKTFCSLSDYVPDLTAHDAYVGVSVEEGDLLFEAFGQGDVIMIHDGEILALRHIEQTITGRRDAEIALVDSVDDARVSVGLHYFLDLRVGRAVVEDEQFEISERLREYAVDGFAQMFGTSVVYGEKYGYAGHMCPSE